jgi:hypothetical protein
MTTKHLAANWTRIRLELARSHEFPEGSTRHGYIVVLPLDKNGRIDVASYHETPSFCTLHRFWEGEGDAVGQVTLRGPRRWAFAYHADREDDEPVPHLAEHVFRAGEYLAVRDAHGKEHVLHIVSTEPAPGLVSPKPLAATKS